MAGYQPGSQHRLFITDLHHWKFVPNWIETLLAWYILISEDLARLQPPPPLKLITKTIWNTHLFSCAEYVLPPIGSLYISIYMNDGPFIMITKLQWNYDFVSNLIVLKCIWSTFKKMWKYIILILVIIHCPMSITCVVFCLFLCECVWMNIILFHVWISLFPLFFKLSVYVLKHMV